LRITAQAQRDAGNFGAAIDALEQSLVILRGQPEPDDRQIASALMVLGQTLKISGDREHAAARYEEALAADSRAPDPAGRVRPAILHGLANLYRDRNEHQRAIALYAEAVPLFVAAYGTQSPQLAQVLNNYANALANVGRYDEAIALYRRALAIAEERKSKDPGDYLPLANIGMVDVWQGRYVEAEAGFRAAIPHLLSTAPGSEASTLFTRIGLAASLWGQKRYDDAFAAAVAAEQLRQAALRLAAARLGERQAISFQEYLRPSLDFVVALAAASGKREHAERAWELSMAARDQVTSITAQRLAAARAHRPIRRSRRCGMRGAKRARHSRWPSSVAMRRVRTCAMHRTNPIAPSVRSRRRCPRRARSQTRRFPWLTCALRCPHRPRSSFSRACSRASRPTFRRPPPRNANRMSTRGCCRPRTSVCK
ncbi:MAG TPA: tetratricopeptide repeat protein, partial [Rhodanobacteraceae bacterium]|nr:tetratricopeptide repeat protein [Rhodanobacteraceae bacterium]